MGRQSFSIMEEVVWGFFLLSVLGQCFRVINRIDILLGWGLLILWVEELSIILFDVLKFQGLSFDLKFSTFM